MARLDELPDDPLLLKRLLAEQRAEHDAELTARDVLIERIKEEVADRLVEQAERIKQEAAERLEAELEAQRVRLEAEKKAAVEAILRRIYGPRSERFDARQLLLFGQRVEELPLDEPSIVEESGQELTTRRIAKKHKHEKEKVSGTNATNLRR